VDWPPTVDDLKGDLGINPVDVREGDDARLGVQLAAAIAHVALLRAGSFNFDADPFVELPAPGPDVALGAVRLAGRWHTRRRSPDGLVSMGELGNSSVPALDADIERLLGVGRYREPMVG
jgi:hypothetical protein